MVESEYFSYIYFYNISSNYEKWITHSVSNLVEFWQDKISLGYLGGFALFLDPYDYYLILNYIIFYLIKDFDRICGID